MTTLGILYRLPTLRSSVPRGFLSRLGRGAMIRPCASCTGHLTLLWGNARQDTIDEMQAKARRWLAAGSREVWLVDGLRSTVEVWRPDAAPTLLQLGDTLLAPGLLPGFSLDLTRLFRRR